MLVAIGADIAQLELVRQMEIDLNGGIGLFMTHHVRQLNVELRSVKSRFARSLCVAEPK